jgi:HTH-type transcriptional regulator/antitoxin HigA
MAPTSYRDLLLEAKPEVIETWKQYETIGQRFGDLVGKGRYRTPDETKLMRLLGVLIQDYDRRHALPPDESTPAERLQYILESSGKKPAELLPIFGQRSHVNEAIRGKRPISVAQAKKLGAMFKLKPRYFL